MAEFIQVALIEEVPDGKGTTVTVNGNDLALFNVEGTIYAMDDKCPHAGASLGFGKLEGRVVTCRAHGWKFNVATGKMVNVPDFSVGCYTVKVEDGKIWVAVP